MNGQLIDALVLAWVYDRGKHEVVVFDEGTDLYQTVGNNWFRQQSVQQQPRHMCITLTKLLPTAGCDLARKNIEAVRLEVHVNDEGIANLGRLHAKQHRVQHAEITASPQGVCNQSSERVPHARRRRYRTSLT